MSETKKFELTPSVSILIAGVIIAGAIIFTHGQPTTGAATAEAAAPNAATTNVPVPSASDHIIGSPNAPIALVEYSDFQCPYCQMIYPSLKQLQSESNGQISWVMRELPLYQIHPQAMPAANAAECIAAQLGNNGFWKFADTIFADQTKLSADYYAQVAGQLGANVTQFNSCMSAQTYSAKIQSESAEAEAAGGQGTPFTIIINTKTGKQYPVSGALPYDQLKAIVQSVQ